MRSFHHVFRPTWLHTLEIPLEPLIARSLARHRRFVEVHAFAFRPRLFELIASTSAVPQLEGFSQHLFRAISRAHHGGIYVGRATRVGLDRRDADQRLVTMRPHLLVEKTIPVQQALPGLGV